MFSRKYLTFQVSRYANKQTSSAVCRFSMNNLALSKHNCKSLTHLHIWVRPGMFFNVNQLLPNDYSDLTVVPFIPPKFSQNNEHFANADFVYKKHADGA